MFADIDIFSTSHEIVSCQRMENRNTFVIVVIYQCCDLLLL